MTPDDETRRAILRWLAANDRNGDYTDEDRAPQGMEPMTLRESAELLLAALRECEDVT